MKIEHERLAAVAYETFEKKPLALLAEKIAYRAPDADNPCALRAIEHAFVPSGSAIRVVRRVCDIMAGSERDLDIGVLSPLPNGVVEITTLVGENEVFTTVTMPAHSGRKSTARGKRGGRS